MAAANTAQGAGSWVAIGEETTEGTSVTPDIFGSYRSETLKLSVNRDFVEPLGAPTPTAIPTYRDTFITEHVVEGNLITTTKYDDQLTLVLLKHLFGSLATAGGGPYTYTFTPTRAQPTERSLTVEVVRGTGAAGVDRAQTYAGIRVGSWELSVQAGALAVSTWPLMGISGEGIGPPTSPTFETGRNVVAHNHATNFTFNSVQSEEIIGLTLRVSKNLERTAALGRLTSGPMQMAGVLDVTLEVTHRYTVNTQEAAYQAKTQGSGSLTLTDGTRSMAFSFAKMEVEDHVKNVSDAGLVTATTTYRVLSTTSSPGISLVVTNGVAP